MSKRSKAGMGIVQVLVGVALLGLLMMGVSQISKMMAQTGKRARETQGLNNLSQSVVAITRDMPGWATKMTSSPLVAPSLSNCIAFNVDPSTFTFNCPAFETVSESDVIAQLGDPAKIWSQKIVDQSSRLIAGNLAEPLYLDPDGIPCVNPPTGPNCRFVSVGYMSRENATGDPGVMTALVRVAANPLKNNVDDAKIKPRIFKIEMAKTWTDFAGSCNPLTQILTGYDAVTREAKCVPNPLLGANCGANRYMAGIRANGQLDCRSLKDLWDASANRIVTRAFAYGESGNWNLGAWDFCSTGGVVTYNDEAAAGGCWITRSGANWVLHARPSPKDAYQTGCTAACFSILN